MAGGVGYLVIADRTFDSLGSLKRFVRRSATVREFRFEFTVATGGAGAAIEAEEKGGLTIAPLAANAQVYVRAEDDTAGLYGKYVKGEYTTLLGVVKTFPETDLDGANSQTEKIVTGAADWMRCREMVVEVTPPGGDNIVICNSDMSAIYAVVEESNYTSRHSRYYCPTERYEGGTMTGYIAKVDAYYEVVGEYCTVTMEFTPKDALVATTMNWVVTAESPLHWENPFQLEGATDCIFTVKDDGATGGNLHIEVIYVEAEEAISTSSKSK